MRGATVIDDSNPGIRLHDEYGVAEIIARAAADAARVQSGGTQASPELVGQELMHALTAESGEVDLLIRTGGEKRLSDFLLWESAYAELLFTDRMWPDFDGTDLDAALQEFRRRQRRFGGLAVEPKRHMAVSAGGAR